MPRVLDAVSVCLDAGRAGHHRASARRPAAHHAGRRARRSRGALRRPASGGRVQHRRRSAAGAARAGARGASRTSARWCRSRRAKSPARRAGSRGRRPSGCPRSSPTSRRAASASACSSMPDRESIRLGGVARRRSRRALHRAVRPGVRARAGAGARARSTRYADAARAGACARPRRQRRARSRSRQPRAVPRAAAPRRGLDRPRASSRGRCSSAWTPSSREYLDGAGGRAERSASADRRPVRSCTAPEVGVMISIRP